MLTNSLLLLSLVACHGDPGDSATVTETSPTPPTATTIESNCDGPSPGVILAADCQNEVDSTACDLQLLDQDCTPYSLSSQRGKVVLLDFSAMWCGPCQSAAAEAQAAQDKFGTVDFTYISVLVNDLNGDNPDEVDINDWADYYGISAPVLIGREDLYDVSGQTGWDFGSIPSFWFIDRDGIIQFHLAGWNETTVDLWIQALL